MQGSWTEGAGVISTRKSTINTVSAICTSCLWFITFIAVAFEDPKTIVSNAARLTASVGTAWAELNGIGVTRGWKQIHTTELTHARGGAACSMSLEQLT